MAGEPILVVDDNLLNLKLIHVLLRSEGYVVRSCVDAEQVLEALPSFRPRVILMDLQLPGTDGLTLTRRIKADPATRDIVVIALTADAMKGDEEKARAAGCDGYLSKPIDIKRITDQLAASLCHTPSSSSKPT
jgi:two-component system, cell cycle response regulator DivK